MNIKLHVCLSIVLILAIAGCSRSHKTTVGLDLDVYLHPNSADPMDIILQTAITKRLDDDAATKLTAIHVRVEDRTVILTGTAPPDVSKAAERIALQTQLTLNGEPIRPREPITNRINTR